MGDPRIVLDEERRGAGAERVFARADAASNGPVAALDQSEAA
jgi:hypothetical protein